MNNMCCSIETVACELGLLIECQIWDSISGYEITPMINKKILNMSARRNKSDYGNISQS